MPLKRVKPKKFMQYRGVSVYHCYQDNDYGHQLDYHFTTDVNERDAASEFDVRDLERPAGVEPVDRSWIPCKNGIILVIQHAIENGVVKRPG